MESFIPAEIEDYTARHSTPPAPHFAALAEETRERTDQAQMQVGAVEGTFLKLLVRAVAARRVLEIGTFTGYSALMMAEGLPEDGELITCDINRQYTTIARRYWAKSPHGGKIRLELGAALDTVRRTDGPFDLVFIDADKEGYVAYWEACVPKVRKGGVIVVDNVLWSGRVLAPTEPSDHAVVRFNAHARDDDRVDLVMLAVRDGITVACKR